IVPFGVTYEKIGTIQRRLAWPLHKDDTLSRSGRPTGLNIYFSSRSIYDRTHRSRASATVTPFHTQQMHRRISRRASTPRR
ncbi:hypothetical protein K474DRAFT_1601383, partial [Panus rudis PR-1116 ss-1]